MNRIEPQVAESVWRRRALVRVLSAIGAAVVAKLALWSAGLPPDQWLVAAQRWWKSDDARQVDAGGPVATRSTSEPADTPVRKASDTAAEGTDSSLSATPLQLKRRRLLSAEQQR